MNPAKMSSIVERKKKGGPSKADPGANDTPPVDIELRRSHRRRSVRYLFDLDDYFDDEGIFEDDEDQKRREKKLKQLLKVESEKAGGSGSAAPDAAAVKLSRTVSVQRAPASSSFDGENPYKKRKIREDADDGNGYHNDGEGEVNNTRILIGKLPKMVFKPTRKRSYYVDKLTMNLESELTRIYMHKRA